MRNINVLGSEDSPAYDRAVQLFEIYQSRGQAVVMCSVKGDLTYRPKNSDDSFKETTAVINHYLAPHPMVETHQMVD